MPEHFPEEHIWRDLSKFPPLRCICCIGRLGNQSYLGFPSYMPTSLQHACAPSPAGKPNSQTSALFEPYWSTFSSNPSPIAPLHCPKNENGICGCCFDKRQQQQPGIKVSHTPISLFPACCLVHLCLSLFTFFLVLTLCDFCQNNVKSQSRLVGCLHFLYQRWF
jgi:hypothetical protein